MEKLHRKYVFAPADKAANNVIIIWKRHYVEVLKGELNSTSTYVPAQLRKDQLLVHHINTITKINVKIDKCELPTFYWLPKLHKRPYKSRFISNSSHCSTTILSKHITSALTAIKDHVMKYSETAFSNSNVNYFWSITANWLEGRTIKYTNFPAKYMNSRSKLHWNIHVVLCLVSVTWNNRWGIGIPELHDHAERHSAFNTSSKWILLILTFMIFFRYFPH